MSRLVTTRLLMLIAAFGCLAATAGADVATDRQAGATRFQSMRICAYENFSRRLNACTRDQSHETIASSMIVCSTTVRTTSFSSRVRGRWTYEGVPGAPYDFDYGDGEKTWISWSVGAGFPLPGGRYQCRFSSGTASATLAVTSGGPAGPVVDTAICDERNTKRYGTDRSFYVCLKDQDGGVVAVGSSIVCNAVYPKVSGHSTAIEVVDEAGLTVSRYVENHKSGLLTQAQKRYGPITKAGRYRCRYSYDGNVVLEKSVTVQ